MEHLFRHWKSISQHLESKRLMLFLDYDGTLTPIVESAGKALIPEKTRKLLSELSTCVKISVISGRELSDLKRMVGVRGIVYSGNHGLEIEGPKLKFSVPLSASYKQILRDIKSRLEKKLTGIKGVVLEDKGFSLSLHYRLVSRNFISRVQAVFHEETNSLALKKKIIIRPGKKVWEVRPPLKWDKGKIVLWLLARQEFSSGNKPLLPIYAGDDITDEDAFRALKNKGITVFVGRPRKSSAQYYLSSPQEVAAWLERIKFLQNGRF